MIAFDKVVAEAINPATSASVSATVAAGGVAAGNLVVLALSHNQGSGITASVTINDGRGNTYTEVEASLLGSAQNDVRSWLFFSRITTALQAGDTISATFSESLYSWKVLEVFAYSGIATSPLDDSATASDDGFPQSQPTGAAVTTTQADALIVSWVATQNYRTWTPTTNWNRRDTQGQETADSVWEYEDRIVSSQSTYSSSPTLSSDDYWNKHCAAFKGSAEEGGIVKVGVGVIGRV
jgi:hypothetical protein